MKNKEDKNNTFETIKFQIGDSMDFQNEKIINNKNIKNETLDNSPFERAIDFIDSDSQSKSDSNLNQILCYQKREIYSSEDNSNKQKEEISEKYDFNQLTDSIYNQLKIQNQEISNEKNQLLSDSPKISFLERQDEDTLRSIQYNKNSESLNLPASLRQAFLLNENIGQNQSLNLNSNSQLKQNSFNSINSCQDKQGSQIEEQNFFILKSKQNSDLLKQPYKSQLLNFTLAQLSFEQPNNKSNFQRISRLSYYDNIFSEQDQEIFNKIINSKLFQDSSELILIKKQLENNKKQIYNEMIAWRKQKQKKANIFKKKKQIDIENLKTISKDVYHPTELKFNAQKYQRIDQDILALIQKQNQELQELKNDNIQQINLENLMKELEQKRDNVFNIYKLQNMIGQTNKNSPIYCEWSEQFITAAIEESISFNQNSFINIRSVVWQVISGIQKLKETCLQNYHNDRSNFIYWIKNDQNLNLYQAQQQVDSTMPLLQSSSEFYAHFKNKRDQTISKEIVQDLHRTDLIKNNDFCVDPFVSNNPLFNVLNAYAFFDKEVGYGQGMNMITSYLLNFTRKPNYESQFYYTYDEETSFFLLIYIMNILNQREMVMPGLPGIFRIRQTISSKLIQKNAKLIQHIEDVLQDIFDDIFLLLLSGSILTLFISVLKEDTPLKFLQLFDVYLLKGESVLIQFIIMSFERFQNDIFKINEEEKMMVFLKKIMFIKGINEGDGIAEYDFINNINYQI